VTVVESRDGPRISQILAENLEANENSIDKALLDLLKGLLHLE
jgi:hypothetical protein